MWKFRGWWVCAFLMAGCTQYPTGGNLRLHRDMDTQPHYRAQRDPRLPAPGTVPMAAVHKPDLPGPALFAVYCSPCHGARGRGDGHLAAKLTKPADLTAAKYLASDDAFFYKTLTGGSGLMPPQAESLWPEERRAVIAHIRKLQRP